MEFPVIFFPCSPLLSRAEREVTLSQELHEECGVFGIYSESEGLEIAPLIYYGLYALQHRGQESCGIAVNQDGLIQCHKGMGLVGDVFSAEIVERLKGSIALGHVRYSTFGESSWRNAQPLVTEYAKGTLSLVHNGTLTNAEELRDRLEEKGAIFQTSIDSEVIAYEIARERLQQSSIEDSVRGVMGRLKGAYSLLIMSPRKLIAARDPYGFRPLCIGRLGESYVFASESCALDSIGATFLRDVEPGEVVVCDQNGLTSHSKERAVPSICIFEYIYFARPDSVIDGVSVYEARREAGRILAAHSCPSADIVIGVPESGLDAATGFSEVSGLPLGRGFVKNSYIGRTFIRPGQAKRQEAVSIKLNPIRSVIQGKRVVLIDDSIVRGTTMAHIVRLLKQAGATEVHVRISAPPFLHSCYYGTDVPTTEGLIARQYSQEEICEQIGADSLAFLPGELLPRMLFSEEKHYCDACFSGKYPDRNANVE